MATAILEKINGITKKVENNELGFDQATPMLKEIKQIRKDLRTRKKR